MDILLIIGIVVVVLWVLGLIFFRSLGCIIHVVLIIGVIILVIWLLRSVLQIF